VIFEQLRNAAKGITEGWWYTDFPNAREAAIDSYDDEGRGVREIYQRPDADGEPLQMYATYCANPSDSDFLAYAHNVWDSLCDIVEAAEMAHKAERCDDYYTCPEATDFWEEGEDEATEDKPWCPWAVRPGKCQPEVATDVLGEALSTFYARHIEEVGCERESQP
jgi:hypothetical protein